MEFCCTLCIYVSGGSRIFPRGGAPTPKIAIIFHIFAENCMKMKEFGPPGGGGGGGARPWRPPLDPPMYVIQYTEIFINRSISLRRYIHKRDTHNVIFTMEKKKSTFMYRDNMNKQHHSYFFYDTHTTFIRREHLDITTVRYHHAFMTYHRTLNKQKITNMLNNSQGIIKVHTSTMKLPEIMKQYFVSFVT